MGRYNAEKEQAAGRMTHETAPPATRWLLEMLNIPYPPGDSHGRRYLDRTAKKSHFMLAPGLADYLGIATQQIRKAQPEPGFDAFATVHDTLTGISGFIAETGMAPTEIMASIHERLGQRQESAPTEPQMHQQAA